MKSGLVTVPVSCSVRWCSLQQCRVCFCRDSSSCRSPMRFCPCSGHCAVHMWDCACAREGRESRCNVSPKHIESSNAILSRRSETRSDSFSNGVRELSQPCSCVSAIPCRISSATEFFLAVNLSCCCMLRCNLALKGKEVFFVAYGVEFVPEIPLYYLMKRSRLVSALASCCCPCPRCGCGCRCGCSWYFVTGRPGECNADWMVMVEGHYEHFT